MILPSTVAFLRRCATGVMGRVRESVNATGGGTWDGWVGHGLNHLGKPSSLSSKLLKLSTRTKSRPAKRSGWGGVGVFGNSSPALSSCPSPCEWSRRNLMRVFLCPRLYARQKSTCRRFNLRRHVMKKRRYFSDLHFFGHLALALFRCKFPGRLSFKYRNTPKRDSGLIHFIEGKAQSLTDRRLQRVDFTGVKQIR